MAEGSANSAVYDAESIQVLEGLQAVRKRPAMYIGSLDERGLHHLVHEVVDNSIDEAMVGFCKNIQVSMNGDGSVTVADDGRGIPVDVHPKFGVPAAELVMSRMHAGAKFERKLYRVSGGLHGVGLSVVTGLSEWLEARIRRDGKEWKIRFERGEKAADLQPIGPAEGTGTVITFKPDRQIFETTEFDFETLATRLRELAFLNKGLRIVITDTIHSRGDVFQFQGGIAEYVKWINRGKTPLHDPPIYLTKEVNGVQIEAALQWHDGYAESIHTFVNNINTVEGGTHLIGFKSALARSLNNYAKGNKYLKSGESLDGDDCREGLTAILSIKMPEPQFEGQTKMKLGNSEMKGIVDSGVYEKLTEFLNETPKAAETILQKAVLASQAREAARKARELTRRKGLLDGFNLPKVRYHKVITMADADVDGQHITTLLLTLFFRYMKPMIDAGYVYIAQPPLYKVRKGKETHYAYTEKQREELAKHLGDKGVTYQRYKGLGEMNAEELWETTMDPARRILKQVTIEDAAAADALFSVLMGEAVGPRRQYIEQHAKDVVNLDI